MPDMSNPDPRIKLLKTFHVVYQHADFDKAKQFLLDFGFNIVQEKEDFPREIYYAGYGPEPYHYLLKEAPDKKTNRFLGSAYFVESREELERASHLPDATGIEKLNAPGGGERVTVVDPIGNMIYLIHGAEEKEVVEPSIVSKNIQTVVPNYENKKNRLGKFHRFDPGPAPVYRWGHYGITYPPGMYQTIYDFYTKTFTLAPTDITVDKDTGKDVCSFIRLDRGKEYVDHHCFFFKRAKPGEAPNVAHVAFEVHDFDIQHLGHDYLLSKGYKSCWGVGRHILGSQVFDYWFDTSGFMIEHFADGDMVNEDTPLTRVVASPEILSVWGPKTPAVF